MGAIATPAVGLTLSTSALLALQGAAAVERLPVHLRMRPRLVAISGAALGIRTDEREALTTAGIIAEDGAVDEDALLAIQSLAAPDAEINVTLVSPERAETYVVVARKHRLVVAAARCGENVTIDAYVDLDVDDVCALVAATVRAVVLGDTSDAGTATFEGSTFPLQAVVEQLCSGPVEKWSSLLRDVGVPAQVAAVLRRCETELIARADVMAYLNQEGGRLPGESVVRVTTTSAEAVMTSFAPDRAGRSWLTVEPYDEDRLERLILAAVRSVPGGDWEKHRRWD